MAHNPTPEKEEADEQDERTTPPHNEKVPQRPLTLADITVVEEGRRMSQVLARAEIESKADARLERVGVFFRKIKAELAALHHDLSAVPKISRPLAERIYDTDIKSLLGLLTAFEPIVALLRTQDCWPADDACRLTEEVPVDADLSARLVELAEQGQEDDFRWLARSQGMVEASLDALWQGVSRRLGQGEMRRASA